MSVLTRSGLVSLSRTGACTLRGKLELLSDEFSDYIVSSDTDPVNLLKGTVTFCSPAELGMLDFEYMMPSLTVLRPYFKRSVASARKGVNIYLHGKRGTGKNQLARVLAQELGCELFEVASEDGESDPINGEQRLRAFRAGQSFFSQRQALILFDEAENVFNDGNGFFGRKSTAHPRRAWINHMFEDNTMLTLWLSNSIDGLDPAFMRRFDMVFELSVPPKKQRLRIIEEACGDLIDAAGRTRMAESELPAPAVVTRAGSVVRLISNDFDQAGASTVMTLLIDNTLQAQGHRRIARSNANGIPEIYDPAFIHVDADPVLLASGLVKSCTRRLCLFGPPGTSKTAYGRWQV